MPATVQLAPARVAARLDRTHAALQTTIGNLLGIAERALDAGDLDGARAAFAEAQPHIARRDAIEACWVPRP